MLHTKIHNKNVFLVSFRDSDVCHYYLCGFCPHELFVNTRADLGPCKKIHDEAIRKEYQVQGSELNAFERSHFGRTFIKLTAALNNTQLRHLKTYSNWVTKSGFLTSCKTVSLKLNVE